MQCGGIKRKWSEECEDVEQKRLKRDCGKYLYFIKSNVTRVIDNFVCFVAD